MSRPREKQAGCANDCWPSSQRAPPERCICRRIAARKRLLPACVATVVSLTPAPPLFQARFPHVRRSPVESAPLTVFPRGDIFFRIGKSWHCLRPVTRSRKPPQKLQKTLQNPACPRRRPESTPKPSPPSWHLPPTVAPTSITAYVGGALQTKR